MSTLFKALLSQHARILKPMRYAEPMTAQLQNFFEEVVLENSLQALVVESLPLEKTRTMREIERVRRIGNTARYPFFLVSPEDELMYWFKYKKPSEETNNLLMIPRLTEGDLNERFVVIADQHFSALLTAVDFSAEDPNAAHQVIYSFDPDVIYTALEYLGARVAVEYPAQTAAFMDAIHRSMPKTTSLHLTLSVTTKLASLWQEQTGREIAVNRIAKEIRHSLELDAVLQTAVNEVGVALGVECCALLIEAENEEQKPNVFFSEKLTEDVCEPIRSDLEAYKRRLKNHPQNYIRDGFSNTVSEGWQDFPQIVVPLSFMEQFVGVLLVQSEDSERVWRESEILLLQTVSDQVAISIQHARLYVKSQHEALRDGLTGVFNRRFFEMQFEREYKLAERKNASFALVMIDIDKFKSINDTYGHSTGDRVLRVIADLLRDALRGFDTLARYGGEEFIAILPQVSEKDALICAERLRKAIETTVIPEVSQITASFGVAMYPATSIIKSTLLKAADKALYCAKSEGRNRVCLAASERIEAAEETETAEENLYESPAAVTF